jgi:hypothetical protein
MTLQELYAQFQNRPQTLDAYAASQGYGRMSGDTRNDVQMAFENYSNPEQFIRQTNPAFMPYAVGSTPDSSVTSDFYSKVGLKTNRDALRYHDPGYSDSRWLQPGTEQNPFDMPIYERSPQYDFGKDHLHTDKDYGPMMMAALTAAIGGAAFMGAGAAGGAAGGGGFGGMAGLEGLSGGALMDFAAAPGIASTTPGLATGGLSTASGFSLAPGAGLTFGGEGLAGLDAAWGVNPRGGMDIFDSIVDGVYNGPDVAASDPFEAIDRLMRMAPDASGVTDAASQAGFGSFQDYLSGINPSWVSPGGIMNSLGSNVAQSAAKSALSKLLSGEGSADDYLKALGALAPGVLGAIGANQQQNAFSEYADKYLALGQPYRDRLNATYQPGYSLMNEPGFADALNVSSKGILSNLSAKVGNPYDNPGAQAEAQKYVMGSLALPQLNTTRSQLGTFGNLGVNTAGTADAFKAQTSGSGLNAVGYGLSNLLNPQDDIQSLLSKLNGSNGFSLNNGMRF